MQLHDYQEFAKAFLMTHPKAGLFLDVGFGKTITTLSTLMDLAASGQLQGHILIIAPKPIARATWIDEMKKWGIQASVVSLIVNEKGKQLKPAERKKLYSEIATHPAAIYMINREMIVNLIEWHIENQMPWPFQTIVVDELQSFKSYDSKRFKYLRQVMPYTNRFIGLTGTPVPNGLMDLWPEICLMDNGLRLGKNITAYRNTFFNPGLTIDGIVVDWRPKPGADIAIYDRIKDLVVSIKNPGLQLPPVTFNDVKCILDPDEKETYDNFRKDMILDISSDGDMSEVIDAKNAAVLMAKLSQMASGTLYTGNGHEYIHVHDRKLEQLEYIINNTTSPVLVAYHFQSDKAEIARYLTERKLDFKVMDGSPEMQHDWNDGKIPVLLLHPASCGHGINIQYGGHTLVWFTLPWSLEHYIQTNGRIYRQGQPDPVVIHHLITEGTVDGYILKALKNKDLSEKALLDAVSPCIFGTDTDGDA